MKVALVGLPASGKTTLFRAVAGAHGHEERGAGQLAAVPIPDERLDEIARVEQPKKHTHATVTFVDVAAVGSETRRGPEIDKLHGLVGDADGFVLVVQAFGEVDFRGRPVDPAQQLRELVAEMLLTDLAIVEGRIERISGEHKAKRKGEADPEWDLLQKLKAQLEAERPVREVELNETEAGMVRGYGLMSARPWLVAFNVAEDDLQGQRAADAARIAEEMGLSWVAICAELEAELAELAEEEREEFARDWGLEQPARERLIRAAFDALDMISFFTVNENEARAWTINRGATAIEAAGKIHTDMQKGFQRAEVISFEDWKRAGSMHAAKHQGLVRLEGRDYVVQDGDILFIRFTR